MHNEEETKLRNKKLDFDLLTNKLGGFGKFQFLNYMLGWYCSFVSGIIVVTSIFGGKTLPHRCVVPSCEYENGTYSNSFLNFTTPWNAKKNHWDSCKSFVELDELGSCERENYDTNSTVECSQWIYDTSQFTSTTSMEFNLSCQNSWLVPMEMSAMIFGFLLGSLFLGIISDMYGRRMGILTAAALTCIGGFASVFVYNYYLLLFTTIIRGGGTMGLFMISFVAAMEFIGPKYRAICGVLLNTPIPIGEAFSGLVSYFFRDWRTLYAVTTIPSILIFTWYWFMSESARWLETKGRQQDVRKVILEISKKNDIEMTDTLYESFINEDCDVSVTDERNSFIRIFSSRSLLKRTIALSYCWSVCSMVYYGLSSYSATFSGDIYINFTAIMLIEIPGFVLGAFASSRFGRKRTLIVTFIGGGIACVSSAFIPTEYNNITVILNMIGKMGITAAFGTIFVYTGEIYPTEFRAIGVGACSMSSRVSGVVAPYISSLSMMYQNLPAIVFGVVSFTAGIVIFFLPETQGKQLPQTLKESEKM